MNNVREKISLVISEVKKVVTGKDECVGKVFAVILAGGHILIEDVPGVGKTTLATAFSKALDLNNHRMQFTPDVMPADILGFNMYRKETGNFVYHPGSIMCNLFLADEINRTSPKTQSALLEVMEEGIVSVDGVTKEVPHPFVVMATQNPKGSAGTQLLPESQLDRFMICMSVGYPDLKSEARIAKERTTGSAHATVRKVMGIDELVELQEMVEQVYVHDHIYVYIAKLMAETRENPYIELGVSPRGTIACTRMVKAWAFLQGRDYVTVDDVMDVFMDVTKHRIVLNTKARISHVTEEDVIKEIMAKVKQPTSHMGRAGYGK